jgi:predicted MFS family arabinose efflux permease
VRSQSGGMDLTWPIAFRAIWLGQTVSSVGSQISIVAIPLIAALTLHVGPFEMAVLGALETLPFVLVALPAGVVADRRDRRRLLITCDVARALAMGVIPIAFATGHGSFLVLSVAACAVGAFSALFTVCQQAYVPEIVAQESLVRANQRLEISESAARVAGPGLASLLFQVGGAIVAVGIDALSYLASAIFIALAPAVVRPRRDGAAGRSSAAREIGTGIRFVWREPTLRALLISTAVFNLASGMVLAQLVLYATGTLGVDAGGFGLSIAIGNIGFLAGAALVSRLETRLGTGVVVVIAAALGTSALWLIAIAAFAGGFGLLILGRFAGAFSAPVFNVMLVTVRQARSPEVLRARVVATFRTVDWATAPAGALLSAAIGVPFGVSAVMLAAGLIGTLSFVCLLRPAIRDMRIQSVPAIAPTGLGLNLEVR